MRIRRFFHRLIAVCAHSEYLGKYRPKIYLLFRALNVRILGYWKKIASNRCIGARNNHYKQFVYHGPSTFIIAMKLVHTKGVIGCHSSGRSYWGCWDSHPTNIIVTGSFTKTRRSQLVRLYHIFYSAVCSRHLKWIFQTENSKFSRQEVENEAEFVFPKSWSKISTERFDFSDTRNKRIYPSPTLISLRTGGWYDLPGYGRYSSELVFSDPGFSYLPRGRRMRIWYGEDLFNFTEGDNHGFTCMDVYVYVVKP